ncbi:hypothetical protein [Streptomyces sp. NPDC086989]|uniref:hypothetical protein n=1 Tax=Streptomyces sp. NPDC086989 TaxID=3365764 RepID=UPI003824DB60
MALAGLLLAQRILATVELGRAVRRAGAATGPDAWVRVIRGFANAPDGGAVTTLGLPVGRLTDGVPRERFT